MDHRGHENPRVFISYRRGPHSSGWVNYFQHALTEKHGISVFVDTQRVDSAVEVPSKIRKEIEECNVFLCLLATGTLKSEWVQTEIRLASENDKPMVPVPQKGFKRPADSMLEQQPHIKRLMEYDWVRLSDDAQAEYTIGIVAQKVKDSFSRARKK